MEREKERERDGAALQAAGTHTAAEQGLHVSCGRSEGGGGEDSDRQEERAGGGGGNRQRPEREGEAGGMERERDGAALQAAGTHTAAEQGLHVSCGRSEGGGGED